MACAGVLIQIANWPLPRGSKLSHTTRQRRAAHTPHVQVWQVREGWLTQVDPVTGVATGRGLVMMLGAYIFGGSDRNFSTPVCMQSVPRPSGAPCAHCFARPVDPAALVPLAGGTGPHCTNRCNSPPPTLPRPRPLLSSGPQAGGVVGQVQTLIQDGSGLLATAAPLGSGHDGGGKAGRQGGGAGGRRGSPPPAASAHCNRRSWLASTFPLQRRARVGISTKRSVRARAPGPQPPMVALRAGGASVGDVRLADSGGSTTGRVEVYLQGYYSRGW